MTALALYGFGYKLGDVVWAKAPSSVFFPAIASYSTTKTEPSNIPAIYCVYINATNPAGWIPVSNLQRFDPEDTDCYLSLSPDHATKQRAAINIACTICREQLRPQQPDLGRTASSTATEGELNVLREHLAIATSEIANRKVTEQNLKEKLKSVACTLREHVAIAYSLQNELEQHKMAKNKYEEQLEEVNTELHEEKEFANSLEDELEEQKETEITLKDKLKALTSQLDSLTSHIVFEEVECKLQRANPQMSPAEARAALALVDFSQQVLAPEEDKPVTEAQPQGAASKLNENHVPLTAGHKGHKQLELYLSLTPYHRQLVATLQAKKNTATGGYLSLVDFLLSIKYKDIEDLQFLSRANLGLLIGLNQRQVKKLHDFLGIQRTDVKVFRYHIANLQQMRLAVQSTREHSTTPSELVDIEREYNDKQHQYADWLNKFREDALANIHKLMDVENSIAERGAEWRGIVKMLGEKALELRSLLGAKK